MPLSGESRWNLSAGFSVRVGLSNNDTFPTDRIRQIYAFQPFCLIRLFTAEVKCKHVIVSKQMCPKKKFSCAENSNEREKKRWYVQIRNSHRDENV